MRRHQPDKAAGRAELRAARARLTGLIASVVLFSTCVNLLMLTGPLFMLQVYDRVLGSRSVETLAALFALVVFLFVVMGLLDHARGRVMARAAARFQCALEGRVYAAVQSRAALAPGDAVAAAGLRDLDAVQRFMASPVLLAIIDMPWTPVFLAAVFLFHPALGLLALTGGGVLVAGLLAWRWQATCSRL